MEPVCPKCSHRLPEEQTLAYRFCPHCGTEIKARSRDLDDALLTVPPALPAAPYRKIHQGLSPQARQKVALSEPAIEAQAMTRRSQPEIKPPNTPPPPGFFRIGSEKKAPVPANIKKQPFFARHRKNVVIGALVLLAVIILIIGGLFTF
jgi:DNA-directed RNA polymerase subunit RPC12/RpoP